MNNLYSKNEFIKYQYDNINESLFSFIGDMFNKLKTKINKIKGGKDVSIIYDKYLNKIKTELKNKFEIDLLVDYTSQSNESNIFEAEVLNPTNSTINTKPTTTNVTTGTTGTKTEVKNDAKKSQIEKLKKNQTAIQNLIDSYKKLAINEMNAILIKMGGAEKNPQLASIIEIKKEQFNVDVLTAEIKILGSENSKNLNTQLNIANNKIKQLSAKLETKGIGFDVEIAGKKFKTFVPYRYKKNDGTIQTINIIKVNNNKLIAKYTYGDNKNKEQVFNPNNIELNFKPKINQEYTYNNTKGELVKVTVLKELKDDKVQVKGNGQPFVINKGALI